MREKDPHDNGRSNDAWSDEMQKEIKKEVSSVSIEEPECSIVGCDNTAVAEILIEEDCYRCPDCLHFDGQENDWW